MVTVKSLFKLVMQHIEESGHHEDTLKSISLIDVSNTVVNDGARIITNCTYEKMVKSIVINVYVDYGWPNRHIVATLRTNSIDVSSLRRMEALGLEISLRANKTLQGYFRRGVIA